MRNTIPGLASILGVDDDSLIPFFRTSVSLNSYVKPGVVDPVKFEKALDAADGRSLEVEPGTYIFPSQVTTSASLRLFCKGKAIFKLADGAIVNTDASYTNYHSILQVRGCDWFIVDGIEFDGNRDNQTYPATRNIFGRGSRPFRHNALLEFVASSDNLRPSKNIEIRRCTFENAYMNGVALWQTGYALVENNDFRNNTWNGLAGCGMLNGLDFRNNRGYRNGVSPVFNVVRETGDRATIQIREYYHGFTAATEKIPTINTNGVPQFSYGVNIIGNRMEEDQVEAVFVRAAFETTIANNRAINIGYQRIEGAPVYNGEVFFPGSIWFEWGTARIADNEIIQTSNNTGWMKPDGIVVFSMEGDGISPITMDGTYTAIVSGNRIMCGQDFDATTTYSDVSKRRNNFYRGIRSNGNVLITNNDIEGCTDQPILLMNDGNYNTSLLKRVTIIGGTIRNFLGEGAIHIQRFGSPTTSGGSILIQGTRIYDGRTTITGATRAMVLFDANLDGQQFDNVTITDNDWDCLNTADSALNYYGVRHRGSSLSKNISFTNNTIRNCYRAFRIAAGLNITINNNTVQDCSRFLEIILTGNIGNLSVIGNNVGGITFAIFDYTYSSGTIARMIVTNNIFQGTGNIGLNNFDATKQTYFILQPNITRMPNHIDLRRTVAAAPTINAMYVGEIISRTDNSTCYIAKNVGTGATDWSLLA
ncbi:putative protein containing Nos-D like domain [Sinorhizobium phage phiM7]|uniref:Uncharacterized protein n=3 Tax=Emdodecavirus TaxID=1980937 RepID=S5MCU8_9CAUD|nr:tail protein [Sinorhizobium phage phiM12]YP_009212334.1 tail protein [Sinorhizobium phage phiN3]YP_009601203.1 tail protein [Sinorhizobium phage phiM7]AKF12986.1 putative protein containing Nos-D like domain [Sinorhizobium phage phiM19]AGR47734.1 putative protein containing NosD-like domain [Sinorhizobium phage phiM12]AKF12626.1 putative protein containing Nos-D like domain [Sinorhizobium phage phiM7]AKF13358.1 putative protein containing Nos-D like domain [Sinorhizobium phage phiN3]